MGKSARQAKHARRVKKARLTVSLSQDVVEYLEAGRARVRAPSMSAYFETIVRDFQAKAEMEAMQAKMAACYDKLGAGETAEEADWGRVGAASLAQLED
jgi:hypothetical protein